MDGAFSTPFHQVVNRWPASHSHLFTGHLATGTGYLGVTSIPSHRLFYVTTLIEGRGESGGLSEARKVRYSVVVKTTETALRADQSPVDQDNTDQLIIQRV